MNRFNINCQRQIIKKRFPLKTAKSGAKIYNLMCNITCRNKAEYRQRRFSFL